MKSSRFPIMIEKDADGYFASCPSVQGCYAQGETYEEAVANLRDVALLCVQEAKARHEKFAAPDSVSFSTLEIAA